MKMKIVIDSREQAPLSFDSIEIINKGLKTGDYSILGYEHKIAIERKSPSDLFGTLGKGNIRFQKELDRTLCFDYFGILVESPFTVVKEGLFDGSDYSRMNPSSILQTLYTLMFKYNTHVIFCNGRNEASMMIRYIFEAYYKSKTKQKQFKLGDNLEMIDTIMSIKRKLRLDK